MRWRIMVMALLTCALAVGPSSAARAQSLLPSCREYGTNKTYGGGWGTMAVIKRGERAGKRGPYELYEVLIRVNPGSRGAVDRTGLVVEGAAFARFGLFGQINGYGREKKVGLRPSLGKPKPVLCAYDSHCEMGFYHQLRRSCGQRTGVGLLGAHR